MIRAVIDTNVLVSALLSPSGNEAFIVLGLTQRLLAASYSEEMMQEYSEVLARSKFSFPPDQISALMRLIREQGERVVPETVPENLPDPSDQKFLSCAITAAVDFIVTGNKRHFPREFCGGIPVAGAAELLYFMIPDDA